MKRYLSKWGTNTGKNNKVRSNPALVYHRYMITNKTERRHVVLYMIYFQHIYNGKLPHPHYDDPNGLRFGLQLYVEGKLLVADEER
jgi:hypothetical protein